MHRTYGIVLFISLSLYIMHYAYNIIHIVYLIHLSVHFSFLLFCTKDEVNTDPNFSRYPYVPINAQCSTHLSRNVTDLNEITTYHIFRFVHEVVHTQTTIHISITNAWHKSFSHQLKESSYGLRM